MLIELSELVGVPVYIVCEGVPVKQRRRRSNTAVHKQLSVSVVL